MTRYPPHQLRQMADKLENESVCPGEVDDEGIQLSQALRQAADDCERLAFGFVPLLEWAIGSIDELNEGPMTADQWGEDAGLHQQARSLLDTARTSKEQTK